MTKGDFLKLARELFKGEGFQICKRTKFFLELKDINLYVEMQHSSYDEFYYINYNICIKELHDTSVLLDDTSVYEFVALPRFGGIIEWKYKSISSNDASILFKKFIVEFIQPFKTLGLEHLKMLYCNPGCGFRGVLKKEAMKYLNLK